MDRGKTCHLSHERAGRLNLGAVSHLSYLVHFVSNANYTTLFAMACRLSRVERFLRSVARSTITEEKWGTTRSLQ